jgi:hypothetical protein
MKSPSDKCPECGGHQLYETQTGARGGYGPNLLPGLGRFLTGAKMNVVLCETCGLFRLYADGRGLEKLQSSPKWRRQ